MQVKVSVLPKSQVKLEITVSEEKLARFRQRALQKLNDLVEISGFRKGKIPEAVLEQHVGEDAIRTCLIDEALPRCYAEAVMSQKLAVVCRPKIKVITKSPLNFEAIVAILPEVKLSDLSKIKIVPEAVIVTEQDIDEIVYDLRKRQAVYKIVERPAQKGDRIEIHFKGFDEEGKEIPGTASRHHPVMIGDKMMVPGFEDQLIGLSKGQKKEFEVMFPADYHKKDFQNRKVKFEVEVENVEECLLPEIDEVFVEQIIKQKKSVSEFREHLKEDLKKYRKSAEKKRRESIFLETIVNAAIVDVPDQLIEEEIDYILDDLKVELHEKGMKWSLFQEYLHKEGIDIRQKRRSEAESRVKARLVLNKAIEEAEIEVTENDIENEVAKLREGRLPTDLEAIKKRYEPESEGWTRLKNRLRMDKLFAKYLGAEV